MKKNDIIRYAFINAIGTALYIIVIASFIYILGQTFGGNEENESILIPIAMLMLFVFSAALTGALMFGRPIMWYLDGKKREALFLIGYTLTIFLIITIIALFFLIISVS